VATIFMIFPRIDYRLTDFCAVYNVKANLQPGHSYSISK